MDNGKILEAVEKTLALLDDKKFSNDEVLVFLQTLGIALEQRKSESDKVTVLSGQIGEAE